MNSLLTALEYAVLRKLLEGEHPILATLRQQFARCGVSHREYTGVGFYADLAVESSAPVVPRDFELGDVHAEMPGLEYGAGFVVFVRNGRLTQLEGFAYGESWPESISTFSLSYEDESRQKEFSKLD